MEILLIEGEPRTATFLMRGLVAEGFQVAQSGSGRAAVERALEHRFDVVVLDLVLHGMNGFDVLKLLHAERPDLPVILLRDGRTWTRRSAGSSSERRTSWRSRSRWASWSRVCTSMLANGTAGPRSRAPSRSGHSRSTRFDTRHAWATPSSA